MNSKWLVGLSPNLRAPWLAWASGSGGQDWASPLTFKLLGEAAGVSHHGCVGEKQKKIRTADYQRQELENAYMAKCLAQF